MSWFLVVIFFFFASNVFAQEDARTMLENLEEEDLKNLDALAMYPEDTRLIILEASLYPEALVKIDRIQSKTKSDFTNLMNQYPEQTQREIWDLTRYPNLIHRLLSDVNRNSKSINYILADYPKVIHQRAKNGLKNHSDLLEKIDALNQKSEAAFSMVISNYEEETQKAFRELIELPEVMTVLTENISVTILVGDAYRNYPDWVIQKADSLNFELARQNAKELEEWKKQTENNPEAAKELQASAEDFAKENGYDDLYYDSEDYDYPDDDLYYDVDDQERLVIEKHYYHNYPYWYGYPTWYAYPRWRPFPYWYDWGFHYRPGRQIVVVHMPSFYFVDWYFYQPRHHYYYPHLSAHFVHHYHGHRHSVGSITSTVHNWREVNRAVISDDMVVNAPRKIIQFKEFGKMETERKKYNATNPRTPISQKKFFDKNKKSYPSLKNERRQNDKLTAKGDQKNAPPKVRKKVKPKTKFPSRIKQPKSKKKKDVIIIKPKKKKEKPRTKTSKDRKTTKKAKDYHQKTWEKTKNKMVSPKPKTRVKPKSKVKPKTKKPTKKKTINRKKTKNH